MTTPCEFQWLRTGDEAFAAALECVSAAQRSVRFEVYTFAPSALGTRFLEAFTAAALRGVRVQVLVDSFGSFNLPDAFWTPLREAGGEVRWFNPLTLRGLSFRDHRKLLICDDAVAFVGGFNVAPQYEGDGVNQGWRDVGLRVKGSLAAMLIDSFDMLYHRHAYEHPPFTRLRASMARRSLVSEHGAVLLSGPGRGVNDFKQRLLRDLAVARHVRIVAAYFLPSAPLRRALLRSARHGAKVEFVMPSRCDVLLSHIATRSNYRRFLSAGIHIYEYQPQVLHSKFVLIDGAVYVGSSNLDPRSLHINYELMLRLTDPGVVAEAADIFADHLKHSQRIDAAAWRASRSWWTRLQGRWACFLLGRLDHWLMKQQLQRWVRPGGGVIDT